uniref:Uncharacterized protein n=1 Tax=Trichogramma kaykai TaxID=54128 RepID=A0ABD2X0N4_9HYME
MPQSHLSGGESNAKNEGTDCDAPYWFLKFDQMMAARFDRIEKRFDIFTQTLREQQEAIDRNAKDIAELHDRLSGGLSRLELQQKENARALTTLHEEFTELASAARSAPAATVSAPTSEAANCSDNCEVRLSGLPPQLNPYDISTVESVLSALGEERLLPHVIRMREWNPK